MSYQAALHRLPAAYKQALINTYVNKGPIPLTIQHAVRLYGTKEVPGSGNNPEIMSWAREVGLQSTYSADSIPWCGLFAAVVAKRAGKEVPTNPLWALNWRHFGEPVSSPLLGDVLVKTRTTSTGTVAGHVAFVLGSDKTHWHVIGGNQSDAVTIARINKKDRLWFRRPHYRIPPALPALTFKATDAAAGQSEA